MASLAWNPTPPDWQTPADPRARGGTSPYYTGYETGQQLQALIPFGQEVNQANLQYLAGGIPNYANLTAIESGNIANLLNPTNFADQQRQAAEKAVAGGFQGSGLANQLGYNLTEDEKIRREQLASQMLSGAANRLPAPFNPASLLTRGGGPSPTAPGVTMRGGPGGGVPSYAPSGLTPGGPPPNPAPLLGTPTRPSSTGNIVSDILARYMPGGTGGGGTPDLYNMASGLGPGFATGAPGDLGVDEFGIPIGPYDAQEYDLTPTAPVPTDGGYDYSGDYGGDL